MPEQTVKRALVYRTGSLGDHLVALPSYRLVKQAFPTAEIRLLTTAPVSAVAASPESLLGPMGLFDGYMQYVARARHLGSILKLVLAVRLWRPQVLVYMSGPLRQMSRDLKFFRLCGLCRIVGVPTEPEDQLLPVGRRNGVLWYEQEGERLARTLRHLGSAHLDDPANWSLALTTPERSEAELLLGTIGARPFFGCSLGTKVQANDWGLDRWKSLLSALAAEYPRHGLVLLGAAADYEPSEHLASVWRAAGAEALNLCGITSPRVSAAMLEHATLFVGHDSGPAHLAASVGTPVVGIFGARNFPGEWVPHGLNVTPILHWVECGGCMLDTCVTQEKKCIVSIGIDEVLLAIRQRMTVASQDQSAEYAQGRHA
jgi:ADP-heptose:LPS heptosyltransferase